MEFKNGADEPGVDVPDAVVVGDCAVLLDTAEDAEAPVVELVVPLLAAELKRQTAELVPIRDTTFPAIPEVWNTAIKLLPCIVNCASPPEKAGFDHVNMLFWKEKVVLMLPDTSAVSG